MAHLSLPQVVEGVKPVWQHGGEMKEGRSFLGSVTVEGRVYQIGGCISEDKSTHEVSISEDKSTHEVRLPSLMSS